MGNCDVKKGRSTARSNGMGRSGSMSSVSGPKLIGIAFIFGGLFFLFAWLVVLIPAWYIASPSTYLIVIGIIAGVLIITIILVGSRQKRS